jgi:methionyl-tRNA formyltransferase
MEIGAKLVVETVDAIAEGNIQPVPQTGLIEESQIKHAPKIFKEDCKIDWKKDAETVRNLIRGLSPYPTAWTNLVNQKNGDEIQAKIFFVKKTVSENVALPGTIESDGKTFLNVACENGWLQVTDLQIAGKKRMKTDEFLRGFQHIGEFRFD